MSWLKTKWVYGSTNDRRKRRPGTGLLDVDGGICPVGFFAVFVFRVRYGVGADKCWPLKRVTRHLLFVRGLFHHGSKRL